MIKISQSLVEGEYDSLFDYTSLKRVLDPEELLDWLGEGAEEKYDIPAILNQLSTFDWEANEYIWNHWYDEADIDRIAEEYRIS